MDLFFLVVFFLTPIDAEPIGSPNKENKVIFQKFVLKYRVIYLDGAIRAATISGKATAKQLQRQPSLIYLDRF